MRARWCGRLIVVLGAVLTVGAVWHTTVVSPHQSMPLLLLDVFVLGGFALSVLYGGYRHATRPMNADRYPRIFAWMVGGSLLFAAVGVIIVYVGSHRVEPVELRETLQMSVSVGLATGLFIGTIEARELALAESAARTAAKNEALQAENERVERLNDLMRHYVLNGANIIGGYAEELKASVPSEDEAALDTIAARAETMATLVEHMRTLTAVDQGDFRETAVRLAPMLESAAEARSGSTVTVTVPGCDATVRANEMLSEALSLFCDALTAVVEGKGSLTVDCDHTGGAVSLVVTATPAELPPPVEQSLFDPVGPGIGLEFYLAYTLVEPYGDVRLVRNDGETVQFELVFDRLCGDAGK